MAKHEIVIHENTSATASVAPYLGSYIAKETVRLAEFASAVGAKCGLPPVQVVAILEGCFEAIEELEQESLVRVHTDVGTICAVIRGSFPTSDAAFDPLLNTLELALRLDDAIRLNLADTAVAIVTDETTTKVRVDNVMDLEEERPMNLIHGQHVFRVAGFNLVLSDESAEAFLQDARGVTHSLVVDEVVSKQLFKAHTAELLDGGDYKLVVKSRGGDAAGPLQTAFRRVKYLRVVDPEPPGPLVTGVHTEGRTDLNPDAGPACFEGISLGEVDEGKIHVEALGDGLSLEGDLTVTATASTQIKATWPDSPAFGSVWENVAFCNFTFGVGGLPVSYTWHKPEANEG